MGFLFNHEPGYGFRENIESHLGAQLPSHLTASSKRALNGSTAGPDDLNWTLRGGEEPFAWLRSNGTGAVDVDNNSKAGNFSDDSSLIRSIGLVSNKCSA